MVGAALRFSGTHMPWMKPFIMKCVFLYWFFLMFLCCSWSKYLQWVFLCRADISQECRFKKSRMCPHHCFCNLTHSKNIARVVDFVDQVHTVSKVPWAPCNMNILSKLTANTHEFGGLHTDSGVDSQHFFLLLASSHVPQWFLKTLCRIC
jgi:hypothetical protein